MVKAVVLQRAVIVAGHPRSGTSLACQLVESAGVDFPADFEGDQYNQAGYYEMEEAKEVSRKLIQDAMTEENTKLMNQVVRRLNDVEGWPGLKIVRIPSLFFYRHVAKELKAVFVYRKPANVKASLFKRGISEFSVPWIKNNNALIAGYENLERSIVLSYESLLNRSSHVKEGFSRLGLNVDFDVIDPEQQSQRDSRVYVRRDEENMHKRLRELETESCRS